MIVIKPLIKLLRLSHWSKASFVLLGIIYSGTYANLGLALLAALCFCLISSAMYIYNDLHDRTEDKLHPYKCKRPLAAGELTIEVAIAGFMVVLISGLSIALTISLTLTVILTVYLIINLAYNHFLKQLLLFDVLCIASGFMLRVLSGTVGIGLSISWWLTFTATLLSLFIALCKRRLEKQLGLRDNTRVVLKKYPDYLLDYLISATAISCFFTYFLYAISLRTEPSYFLLTLPFAALGLWRFVWLTTHSDSKDDPLALFAKDNLSCFNLFYFLLITVIALIR